MTLIFLTKLDKIYGEERRGENREGIDTGPLEKFSSLKSLQLLRASCMCVETPPKGLPTPQNKDIADCSTTRAYLHSC